jgi:5'-3' exonuclease
MELNTTIKKEFEAKIKYNSKKSEMKCEEMINKCFNSYRFPEIDSVDAVTASLVQEKYEEFRKGIK